MGIWAVGGGNVGVMGGVMRVLVVGQEVEGDHWRWTVLDCSGGHVPVHVLYLVPVHVLFRLL